MAGISPTIPFKTMRKNGVSFIPENPLMMASVPFMTVLENMALTDTGAMHGAAVFQWIGRP